MSEEANTDNVFELGICMAGAVSAGAYTAGAMDYLIEALQTWEEKRGEPGVPSHRVVIKVIGGASAGGMTGIITASAINNPIPPISRLNHANIFEEHPQNKLYHTWVDLLQEDMFSLMLKNDDISQDKVYSLVNSGFIDALSNRAVEVDAANRVTRQYFDNNLRFFTTLTNIQGFRYKAAFLGDTDDYYLARHNDFAAFILNKQDEDYANDGFTPVDFFARNNVDTARESAMATGAFPIGLKSRWLYRDKKHVEDLGWNRPPLDRYELENDPYRALIVDGGTLNNEPFLKVRDLMGYNKNTYQNDHSVIMIDPFPSERKDIEFNLKEDANTITKVAGLTLGTMLSHARTKPELLDEMYDPNNLSVFQIAPRKEINGDIEEGSDAIACGFMEGFGGFLNKEFRIHDYFLGRANCERFLREHFTVPDNTNHPVFLNGYQGVSNSIHKNSNKDRWQIIPLFEPEKSEPYFPPFQHQHPDSWPVRDWKAVKKQYRRDIRLRVQAIAANIDLGKSKLLKGRIVNFLVGWFARNGVLNYIEKQMQCHKLLIGYPPCKDKDDKK